MGEWTKGLKREGATLYCLSANNINLWNANIQGGFNDRDERVADTECVEIAAEIEACVNAMTGIPDPAATMKEVVEELTRLRNVFDGYVSLHLSKQTPEGEVKAERNAAHVRHIDALLAKLGRG